MKLVDDRNLLWKTNQKLFSCGLTFAPAVRFCTGRVRRTLLSDLSSSAGNSALHPHSTRGDSRPRLFQSIGRIKSEDQRYLTRIFYSGGATTEFKSLTTESTEAHRAKPQRNALIVLALIVPLWNLLCVTLWLIFSGHARIRSKKIMRSGPATRTACCRMNFTLTL